LPTSDAVPQTKSAPRTAVFYTDSSG